MTVIEKFRNLSLSRFLEEIELNNFSWIVKRLSGNDTGLTGGHQSGMYLPSVFFKRVIPEIYTTKRFNPDAVIEECYFPAQNDSVRNLKAKYYNSKYFPEKRLKKNYDEFRLTRWGGRNSPVQKIENTGSLCLFAIGREQEKLFSVAWVASSLAEEDLIENWLGSEVEPGRFQLSGFSVQPANHLTLPVEWFNKFPKGRDIFRYIAQQIPRKSWTQSVDKLLLKRRNLEFEVFEKIEQMDVMPNISKGFTSVQEFVKYSHSVTNRRKSRTGNSLELNLESIFLDENISFETQVITENRKKPDFIFPSGTAYHANEFPSNGLHMMAAKTCCKDRWRQILNEANRITTKHLFTLQQGVSSNQLQEMKDNNVELVVPEPHLLSFPKEWRKSLLVLDGFVTFIKKQQQQIPRLEQWTS